VINGGMVVTDLRLTCVAIRSLAAVRRASRCEKARSPPPPNPVLGGPLLGASVLKPAAVAGGLRDDALMWFIIGAVVAVVALLVFGVHRLLLWAEQRGWVYYRKTSPPHGTGALAMQELAKIYEPQAEHVIEATRSERIVADHEDAGDKPFWEVPSHLDDETDGSQSS